MPDVHEFVYFTFRPGPDREAQFRRMEEIEALMLGQPGLKRRECFYSQRDRSWVTHLVWADEESIEAAGERIEADPEAIALFEPFDLDSMRYAKFEQVSDAAADDRLAAS
jgi:hypothetical protein